MVIPTRIWPTIPTRKAVQWLALALGLGITGISAVLYQAVKVDNWRRTDQAIGAVTRMLESRLSNEISAQILSLERLSRRWESRLYDNERALRIDAQQHIRDLDALLAIGRVNGDFSIRWHEFSVAKSGPTDLAPPAHHASQSVIPAMSYPSTITMIDQPRPGVGPLLYFYTPVFETDSRDTLMYAAISLQRLFDLVITPDVADLFSFVVRSDGIQIYPIDNIAPRTDHPFRHVETLTVKDRIWDLEVQPQPLFLARNDSALPETILVSGILLAIAAVIAFYFWRSEFDQRKKLNHVFDSTPNGLILVDRDGRIQLANAATERMFGYGREELTNQPIEMLLDPSLAEKHRKYRALFDSQPQTRLMGRGRDLYGRHRDGRRVPLEVGLNPLQTVGGKFTLAAIVDITERQAREQQLEEQREALRRSNEALQDFSSMAAHDMREPLRVIKGYTQMILDESGDNLAEPARKRLDYIQHEVARLQALTSDLLTYARVDAQEKTLAPVALERPVQHALENLYLRISESGAAVSYGDLPMVWADADQLVDVFQNLIENAIKYRGSEPPRVHISAHKDEDMWKIVVHDNGEGVPAAARDKIFEIFQRSHPRSHSPGTGLGLSICQKIIERHGGRIWVEPGPDGGSCFCFTLRAVDESKNVDFVAMSQ